MTVIRPSSSFELLGELRPCRRGCRRRRSKMSASGAARRTRRHSRSMLSASLYVGTTTVTRTTAEPTRSTHAVRCARWPTRETPLSALPPPKARVAAFVAILARWTGRWIDRLHAGQTAVRRHLRNPARARHVRRRGHRGARDERRRRAGAARRSASGKRSNAGERATRCTVTDLALRAPCDLAARLAVAAGELVFEGRKDGLTSISTKSTDTDIVTEFDRASERLIVDGLRAARPDDAIVGEEGTDSAGRVGDSLADRSDRRHHQLPLRPARLRRVDRRAVGRRPAGRRRLHAGQPTSCSRPPPAAGRTLNGAPIRCSTTSSLHQALVATGFCYQIERRRDQAQRIAEVIPEDPRHPPARRSCRRPVLRRRRATRRVLRAVARTVGFGRRRADRARGRLPHRRLRRRSDRRRARCSPPTRHCSTEWSSCWRTRNLAVKPGIM